MATAMVTARLSMCLACASHAPCMCLACAFHMPYMCLSCTFHVPRLYLSCAGLPLCPLLLVSFIHICGCLRGAVYRYSVFLMRNWDQNDCHMTKSVTSACGDTIGRTPGTDSRNPRCHSALSTLPLHYTLPAYPRQDTLRPFFP